MSLKDRLKEPASSDRAFACPHYDPPAGGRRCRSYLDGGACGRPDEFMCVEWLKANGHAVPPPLAPTAPEPESPAAPNRDLFGAPVPPTERAPDKPALTQTAGPAPSSKDVPIVRNLTDEEIASFKALRAELCLRSEDVGEIWLVPEYTRTGRKEISVEHASTLAAICAAFPGAKVVSFEPSAAGSDGGPADAS